MSKDIESHLNSDHKLRVSLRRLPLPVRSVRSSGSVVALGTRDDDDWMLVLRIGDFRSSMRMLSSGEDMKEPSNEP